MIHIYQTQYLVFKTLTIVTDAKHLDEKGESNNRSRYFIAWCFWGKHISFKLYTSYPKIRHLCSHTLFFAYFTSWVFQNVYRVLFQSIKWTTHLTTISNNNTYIFLSPFTRFTKIDQIRIIRHKYWSFDKDIDQNSILYDHNGNKLEMKIRKRSEKLPNV